MNVSTYVTAAQIASIVGVSAAHKVGATLRRNGIEPSDKRGRSFLYDMNDVARVECWRGILDKKKAKPDAIAIRKGRTDRGRCRVANEAAVTEAVAIARSLYLSSGTPDCRMACDQALRLLASMAERGETTVTPAEVATINGDWFYRRWVMRRDASFLGPFYSEGWRELWRQAYRQHEAALTSPYAARVTWKILESAGWAGEGYGFGWMIALDDRTADVWTVDDGGRNVLPNAIYVWDVLTGALLWVEPSQTVTTQAYIRAILGAVFTHGLTRAPLITLENAKAAKSVRIENLIRALYTQDDLDRIWADKNLVRFMNGQRGPVFRNLPHIAREWGKASAERAFGEVKRQHDSRFHADAFQGGNRSEAVQLHRSNMPWFYSRALVQARQPVTELKTRDDYFRSLIHWSQTEYLDYERPSLKGWSKAKRLPPCRRSLVEYYGGTNRGEINLPVEQFGAAIYEATPKRFAAKVRAIGRLGVQIDGQPVNLVSPDITHELVGRRCGVVPVPNNDGLYVVVLLAWESNVAERFVCIARDLTADHVDRIAADRQIARAAREESFARVDVAIANARTSGATARPLDPSKRITQPTPAWIEAISTDDAIDAEVISAEAETDPPMVDHVDDDDEICRLYES